MNLEEKHGPVGSVLFFGAKLMSYLHPTRITLHGSLVAWSLVPGRVLLHHRCSLNADAAPTCHAAARGISRRWAMPVRDRCKR